jgi:hypothetical protein
MRDKPVSLDNGRTKPSRDRLVTTHGIAIHIYRILLGAPEILFGFIGLTLPTPLLHGGEMFLFLVSLSGRLSALAADQNRGANDEAAPLKIVHAVNYKSNGGHCNRVRCAQHNHLHSTLGVGRWALGV